MRGHGEDGDGNGTKGPHTWSFVVAMVDTAGAEVSPALMSAPRKDFLLSRPIFSSFFCFVAPLVVVIPMIQ